MTFADGSVVQQISACAPDPLTCVSCVVASVAGGSDRVARYHVESARPPDLLEVRQPGLAVVVVAVDEGDLRLVAFLEVGLHRHRDLGVVDRHLERPLMLRDRRHDAHARRVRDERNTVLLRERRDRERRRRQRRAEDRDRVLVEQLAEVVHRRRRIRLIVEDRQLDRVSVDPAGLVDLLDGHLHAVRLRTPERRTRAALRENGADDVRFRRGRCMA